MEDAWSEALKEAYASAPVDIVVYPTLEISHPTLPEPVRLVIEEGEKISDDPPIHGRMLRLEETAPANAGELVPFVSCAVTATLPAATEKEAPEMALSIDNVPGELMEALERAVTTDEPIGVIYREYLDSDPDTVHFSLDGLTLRRVTATMYRIEGRAGFLDLYNRQFLTDYTAEAFPSLVS